MRAPLDTSFFVAAGSGRDPIPAARRRRPAFAGIVAGLRDGKRRVRVLDAPVAATASVEGIPVITQDRDDTSIPGIDVILV